MNTERLVMRRWRKSDREPFARLNADPEVMEHFVAPMSREQSDLMVDKIERAFDRDGFGLWALEVRESGAFIGFAGLALQTFDAHFTPAMEVGWRLARNAWGHGYATEAGRAAVGHAFESAGLAELVSMTSVTNVRSQSVMRRLGMTRDPADDFLHPSVPEGHRLQPHVLYRLKRP
ncbi:GNAT family N-acetyltransferase [Nonomuraea sp. NN258]|uniref:GNAT family N-acetyltransferase n=1 Tax=Nonomuraea antri TaxID=2730852 RepID=UPI001568A2D5|nr:GNAT family N-acetyltransferase [Nonomuraea antri]NRQ39251.1 GNAT family N-acetyltransferase [Nonomuraea antri]